MIQLQPYIQRVVNDLALPDDAELSTAFAELLEGMAVLTNEEDAVGLRDLQSQLFMCLFQDFGLTSRAFTVEMGLKTLLKLSGKDFPPKHFLLFLHELLPSQARNQLDYSHRLFGRPDDFPEQVTFIPSVQETFRMFDNMYTRIRYRPEIISDEPMLTAWYNLEAVSQSLLFTVFTHKSNRDMRHAALADIVDGNE